jgi:hypothetical protein
MASNLEDVSPKELVDELLRRMPKLPPERQETFRSQVLKECGYTPRTEWEEAKQDLRENEDNASSFFAPRK